MQKYHIIKVKQGTNYKINKHKFSWKAYDIEGQNEVLQYDGEYLYKNNKRGEEQASVSNDKIEIYPNMQVKYDLGKVWNYSRKEYINRLVEPISNYLSKLENDTTKLSLNEDVKAEEKFGDLILKGNGKPVVYATDKRYSRIYIENAKGIVDVEGISSEIIQLQDCGKITEIKVSQTCKELVIEDIRKDMGTFEINDFNEWINRPIERLLLNKNVKIDRLDHEKLQLEVRESAEKVEFDNVKVKRLYIRANHKNYDKITKIKINSLQVKDYIEISKDIVEIFANIIKAKKIVAVEGRHALIKVKNLYTACLSINKNMNTIVDNGYIDVIFLKGDFSKEVAPIQINIMTGNNEQYIEYDGVRPLVRRLDIYRGKERVSEKNMLRNTQRMMYY